MIEGEVRCGACLFDFSVLGSRTEKSSDLVQMRPWSVSYTHLDVYKRQGYSSV